MEAKKVRVFLFYGKGKPVFLPQLETYTWDDFISVVFSTFEQLNGIPCKDLTFVTDSQRPIKEIKDVFEEPDALIYIKYGDEEDTTLSPEERERKEREIKRKQMMEQKREARRRRMEEREEKIRLKREKKEQEERERQEAAALEEEEEEEEERERNTSTYTPLPTEEEIMGKINRLSVAGYDRMSELEKKIAKVEHFGEIDFKDPRKIRVFLKVPGRSGAKVIYFMQYTEDFTWKDFKQRAADELKISPVDRIESYWSMESKGKVSSLDEVVPDDVISVAIAGTDEQDIQREIEQLKKKEAKHKAAKQREMQRIAEKAREERVEAEAKAMERMSEEQRAMFTKLKEAETKEVECPICYDDVPARDIYVIDKCGSKFCRNCMEYHINVACTNRKIVEIMEETEVHRYLGGERNTKEDEGNTGGRRRKKKKKKKKRAAVIEVRKERVFGIVCPASGCDHLLGHHEVRSIAPKHLFTQYENLLTDKAIERAEDLTWCKTPDCGNVLVRPNEMELEGSPLQVCFKCGYCHCSSCDTPWHPDMSCALFQASKNKDPKVAAWVMKNTKDCPFCNVPIEKNDGCNHMSCVMCGHHFCWLCLGDFKDYSHFGSGCSMYS